MDVVWVHKSSCVILVVAMLSLCSCEMSEHKKICFNKKLGTRPTNLPAISRTSGATASSTGISGVLFSNSTMKRYITTISYSAKSWIFAISCFKITNPAPFLPRGLFSNLSTANCNSPGGPTPFLSNVVMCARISSLSRMYWFFSWCSWWHIWLSFRPK